MLIVSAAHTILAESRDPSAKFAVIASTRLIQSSATMLQQSKSITAKIAPVSSRFGS